MAVEDAHALTFVLVARIPLAGIETFRNYEAQVLPLLDEHGGSLQRRLRNDDGTVEVHIVSFGTEADARTYRNDPRRLANAHLLEASAAKMEQFAMWDVD